jgi:hypothetical protein
VSGLVPGLTTVTPAVIGGSVLVGIGIAVGLSARAAPAVAEGSSTPPLADASSTGEA